MKKKICMLFVLLILGIFCLGMVASADETETAGIVEYKELGFTIKATTLWEGLEGSLMIFPVSSTSICDNPEVFAAYAYYIPMAPEEVESQGDSDALMDMLTMPAMLFSVKGDSTQLVEALKELGAEELADEDGLVRVGEADGYQFFVFCSLDEEYAATLDDKYAEDYNNLPSLFEKELKQAQYYAPVDAMKTLEGRKLSFTSTDLDGNTLTSEELFKDNEITMVNLWGVWCVNCVNEMEELAEINTRLQDKGCGIVGIEWEEDPGDETYQQARDLMEEKGTNYPSVLMPEDNEILGTIENYPATFFVDSEGTILTKPIIGARVKEYEPTLEALLEGLYIPETEIEEAQGYTYRVFVMDDADQPLEEAVVQFCDETACRLGETDEDGCAVFEVPEEKSYTIHILEAPDGYAWDEEEEFLTDETASDTTVVLKKAE